MKRALKIACLSALALAGGMQAASADLIIPSFTYRTGPYAGGGIPLSDGFADYFTLLNERDGGINGVPVKLIECEYGYNTEKGVECFNEFVEQGALTAAPFSTGLAYWLIPLANEIGFPIHTMGYGLTAVADGDTFDYFFNFPAHYWHGAYAQIEHLKELSGGSLEGKTIAHVYHNSGYGREPIPTLEALAEKEGFNLVMAPVDHPGEDQKAVWDAVMAENPDYVLLWGWGVMNEVAIGEAIDRGFPIENMVGIWWSASEDDVRWFRDDSDGYRAVTFHALGTDFSIYNDMNMIVYQAGKARGDMNNIGDVLYNRGMAQAAFIELAIRKAMEIHGTTEITREMLRDGYEQLEVSEDLLAERGIEGFIPPMHISCENHVGEGLVAVGQWSSRHQRWLQITDYMEPQTEILDPQIEAASKAYAQENGFTSGKCN